MERNRSSAVRGHCAVYLRMVDPFECELGSTVADLLKTVECDRFLPEVASWAVLGTLFHFDEVEQPS